MKTSSDKDYNALSHRSRGRWFTARWAAAQLGVSLGRVKVILREMRESGLISSEPMVDTDSEKLVWKT